MTPTVTSKPSITRWPVPGNYEIKVKRTSAGYVATASENGTVLDGERRIDIAATFDQCVWKGTNGNFESRLFRNADASQKTAVLVSLNTASKRISALLWNKSFNDEILKTQKPEVQIDDGGVVSVAWTPLDAPRITAFDSTADADVVREEDIITTVLGSLPAKVIGGLMSVKVAQVAYGAAAYGTSMLASGLYATGSFVLTNGADYVLYPAVETFGYSGLAIAGVIAADHYLPQYQIIPKIKTATTRVLNFGQNLAMQGLTVAKTKIWG